MPSETRTIHVLLVEDDAEDAMLMQKLLLKIGGKDCIYEVTSAVRVSEALELLNSRRFDLILLDLSLPDSQGLATYEQIQPAAPGVSIVICSGLSDKEVAVEAIARGAQDYMVKGDITQSIFERVLRYALERRKVQEMREEFVGMVVHELRSPLSISIEGTKQMLDGILGAITPDQRFFLEMVHRNMNRLNLLINDLLDITKIEIGKMKLEKTRFDVVRLTQEVCASFRPSVESRGLEMRQAYSHPKIEIEADSDKITQVYMNLLSNALKFTEKGFISVSVKDIGHDIECSVEDTGAGIPPEGVEKLFNKFEQFGRPAAAGEKGTGLGLVITKGIVTAHQGRIHVESQLGRGTKIVFIIPKFHALMPV